MAEGNEQPIIIKKVKKGRHPHHGGAWKVAYADFVTAMMAFFLLLWLLNATTEEQRKGIADYFSPTVVSNLSSGAGGMLGGTSVSTPGARSDPTATPSISVELRPTRGASDGDSDGDGGTATKGTKAEMSDEERNELDRRDAETFAQAEQKLRQAITESEELRTLQQHLVIDQTPEGLRIQIVDRDGRPMFPNGSSAMFSRTRKLVAKISEIVRELPNQISVSGHTDSQPFHGARRGYGNWELSASRANATRRALVDSGLKAKRIQNVVGRADTDPLVPEDPTSARNRRISIVLLRRTGNPHGAKFRQDWTGPRLR